ncbi:hypothetical protein PIROE2DRAFT_5345 [Piromyces sp. E2]|nr:hypothetical protein PIROE2DRAFT_5345 [Piromyces sp. E2]|eukprot:OUM67283.1 hypothetical protein PIROE2DRAFT_5345 [Piromyces sp. E2]
MELFNKYVIPYMDRFSGRIDNYAREITDMSKKYASVAWQKGLEIAQTKFFEVLTKGPSALMDFSNIQLNFNNNNKNNDNGRIREINDDDDLTEDYSENSYQRNHSPKESNQKQMVLQKKRSTSNSNIKKFGFGLNRSNAVNDNKKIMNKMNDEYDGMDNKRNLNRTPSFRRNANNKRNSTNSPYSRFDDHDGYDDFENNNYDVSEKSTKSNNSLYMSMMSNHRPGPGGMMGINDVYSSESDHSNSNSNDSNYFIDEEIEEPYNYNKSNVYYNTDQRKGLSKVNQRSMRDNYYDYDYDLTREDEDTIDVNDIYNDHGINPKMAKDNNKSSDMNYQQGLFSNFNSIFR